MGGSCSYPQTFDKVGQVCWGQTLKLIGHICKLQRKCSVVNTDTGIVFTIPYYLLNLQMDPISSDLTLHYAKKSSHLQYTSLFGTLVSYGENEAL